MSSRITSFEDIRGHKAILTLLTEQLDDGSLPHFIIFEGEEGLGKTTIADLLAIELTAKPEEKESLKKKVIIHGHSTSNIKKYRMSVEGGKAAVKDVLSEFNTSFVTGNKVIIMDECHGMSSDAQDVLLNDTDTGRIPDNLYIFLLTTEIGKIKPQLRSRAVTLHLSRLSPKQMLALLKCEALKRGIEVQGGDVTFELIANWAECKPRTALSILDTFKNNSKVSASIIKELIGYLEVDDVLPLISSLGGSLTWGLDYIDSLRIDKSFVDIAIEVMKIRLNKPSYKLRSDEMYKVRSQVNNVPERNLMKFVYLIASDEILTRSKLVSAFIQSHVSFDRVMAHNVETLTEEKTQRALEEPPPLQISQHTKAPTMEELLANSSIVQ